VISIGKPPSAVFGIKLRVEQRVRPAQEQHQETRQKYSDLESDQLEAAGRNLMFRRRGIWPNSSLAPHDFNLSGGAATVNARSWLVLTKRHCTILSSAVQEELCNSIA